MINHFKHQDRKIKISQTLHKFFYVIFRHLMAGVGVDVSMWEWASVRPCWWSWSPEMIDGSGSPPPFMPPSPVITLTSTHLRIENIWNNVINTYHTVLYYKSLSICIYAALWTWREAAGRKWQLLTACDSL